MDILCIIIAASVLAFIVWLVYEDQPASTIPRHFIDQDDEEGYDPDSLEHYLDDPSGTPMSNKWKLGDWDD